ncbi:alanine--tRNA ligase, partial [Gammaproteobacteria bacterium]|nr:alanine--tRNA ligase [Gammaproteobacteria bacterium]
RSAFLDFFGERNHRVVASDSLVPTNDPTLLFTNSGMVQFKDALLGRETRDYARAVSCQRCVRAGGKHNDLENVGYTARHHTLFEMLGNFSFGDYFKEETIGWAWQFVTEILELPEDRLWVTVHPTDADARAIWTGKIGLAESRVIDLEDNFWAMGETGPCGPDTEIFFDQGPELAGGPPGSSTEDGDRFLEFWNLVFPQFDRAEDGSLASLPTPGVDTGMGLERVAALTQGVPSNYEIDLFQDVIRKAAEFAGLADELAVFQEPSLRVISDHIRSAAFLIADGVVPGNEERNYVLRRIIRRALRHGNKLNIREPFFHRLVEPLVNSMGDAYPLLSEEKVRIEKTLLSEEERFAETLGQGMAILESAIDELVEKTVPGEVVFKLYDTFGFPADLTADVARERGLEIDVPEFEKLMAAQRERGRAASRFDSTLEQRVDIEGTVEFFGYDGLAAHGEIVGLYRQNDGDADEVRELEAGEAGVVILDRTPFYAESGGQVGDTGTIQTEGASFLVNDTTRGAAQHLHYGLVESGRLSLGEAVNAEVFSNRRNDIARNHSATHLLHAALRQVLGNHVQQKGSLVDAERLRFDFSHVDPLEKEEVVSIEEIVNKRILDNSEILTEQLGYDQAIERGALALFGEKYGDDVRVLSMGGDFSVELCGGTHARRTGDIGLLKIVSESGIAAGIRRIEAVTGRGALVRLGGVEEQLNAVAEVVRGSREELVDKVKVLLESNRRLEKEVQSLRSLSAESESASLAARAIEIEGIKVLSSQVAGDSSAVMALFDGLRERLGDCVIALGYLEKGKVSLVCGVNKKLTNQLKANDLVRYVGAQVGARGGGRDDMAKAGGGDNPEALDGALGTVAAWVAEKL